MDKFQIFVWWLYPLFLSHIIELSETSKKTAYNLPPKSLFNFLKFSKAKNRPFE